MKLVAQEGLWSNAQLVAGPPAVAVLEISGAVLAWTVDDPAGPAQITFTDLASADWLWRVVGEAGHVAVYGALNGRAADAPATLDLTDVEWAPGTLAPLRRLALGHWLRRWWPASERDGIAELDNAVLDAEIAVLTAQAEAFFAEDTFDSDIAGLLHPHRETLAAQLRGGDPRVAALVEAAADLADWADLSVAEPVERRRDDYALAAGDTGARRISAIASGSASISWTAVPPGVFDGAEDTVTWSVTSGDAGVVARIRAAVSTSADGVAVTLHSGDVRVDGILDARGRATLPLPLPESAAWNRDWTDTSVHVGGIGDARETRAARERIRAFARSRVAVPAADAYLAEILASEADY